MKKGDALLLSLRHRGAPGDETRSPVPYRTAAGMAEEGLHGLPDPPRPDRPARPTARGSAVRLMQEPVKALTQSYTRTKARNLKAFRESMDLHTNSSNNTIYADADGTIAYFHGNFIPRRDPRFDWTQPVDGSDPATEWSGCCRWTSRPTAREPGERLALQLQQLARGRRPARAARRGPTSRRTWTAASENPRGVHALRRPRQQEGLHARLAPCRRVRQLPPAVRGRRFPRWSRPGSGCRPTTR